MLIVNAKDSIGYIPTFDELTDEGIVAGREAGMTVVSYILLIWIHLITVMLKGITLIISVGKSHFIYKGCSKSIPKYILLIGQ